MLFSVIYSADVPADIDVLDYAPPHVAEKWDETEDDECFEYGYLEGRWEGGHHRKWCALLNRDQFDEFIERCGLVAESCETMGSLGPAARLADRRAGPAGQAAGRAALPRTPGFGFGWAPAISFASDDPNAIQSAYVTPIPEVERDSFDEQDWQRVRSAVLAVYG